MPWCAGCDRFLNPNTLRPDGTCPSCESQVATATAAKPEGPPSGSEVASAAPVEVKAPWHFKLLVVLTVIYLVWRFGQLLGVLPM